MKKLFRILAVAVAAAIPLIGSAWAGETRIESFNRAGDRRFVYAPALVRVQPGDSVVFVPTDKGHNTVSIDGMLQDRAQLAMQGGTHLAPLAGRRQHHLTAAAAAYLLTIAVHALLNHDPMTAIGEDEAM